MPDVLQHVLESFFFRQVAVHTSPFAGGGSIAQASCTIDSGSQNSFNFRYQSFVPNLTLETRQELKRLHRQGARIERLVARCCRVSLDVAFCDAALAWK